MDWYKHVRKPSWTGTVKCPDCLKEWVIDNHKVGWQKAKELQEQGRQAEILCDECFRKRRRPS